MLLRALSTAYNEFGKYCHWLDTLMMPENGRLHYTTLTIGFDSSLYISYLGLLRTSLTDTQPRSCLD